MSLGPGHEHEMTCNSVEFYYIYTTLRGMNTGLGICQNLAGFGFLGFSQLRKIK